MPDLQAETVTLTIDQLADLVLEVIRQRGLRRKPLPRTIDLVRWMVETGNQPRTVREMANQTGRRHHSIRHAIKCHPDWFQKCDSVPNPHGGIQFMCRYTITPDGIEAARSK